MNLTNKEKEEGIREIQKHEGVLMMTLIFAQWMKSESLTPITMSLKSSLVISERKQNVKKNPIQLKGFF